MNYLQVKELLAVTSDEYAVVKLTGNSRGFMEQDEPLLMKMAKEQEKAPRADSKKKRKNSAGIGEQDEPLFEKLRSLRMEIAREEKVPPYIVFSDKTLTHMCIVKPKNKQEMLSVSGVGEFKYQKYGERFLGCIEGFGK